MAKLSQTSGATNADLNSPQSATPTDSETNAASAAPIVAPKVPKGPISAFYVCYLIKYVEFRGRAGRSEYWYWHLSVILISLTLYVVYKAMDLCALECAPAFAFWSKNVVSYAVAPPNWTAAARRLHDLGLTGWISAVPVALWFIPIPHAKLLAAIAIVALLVLFLFPGRPEANKYGPAQRLP